MESNKFFTNNNNLLIFNQNSIYNNIALKMQNYVLYSYDYDDNYLNSIKYELENIPKTQKNSDYENIINNYIQIYLINNINQCIICKRNLGQSNPRQYCSKTFCPYEL